MVVINIYFTLLFCVLILWSSNEAINIDSNNYDIKINENFLKNISHHYCDRLTGTNVILLAEKYAESFYKVLQRSFHSTFYVHSTLVANASLSDYYIIFIEDETFFFEESIYDDRFWHTTKTYLIVSERKLKTKIIWPHIRRIWETFKVFKISLLNLNNLKVLRIFDDGFYNYVAARKLNYGIKNVKKYPLRVVIFPRMPSIVKYKGEWTGPDWNTLQAFSKRMNFALKISFFPDHSGSAFGQRLINGSYTGVLAEVVYDRADVSFNSRFLNDPMIQKPYHYTRTNGLDFICFIVPKAKTLTRLQILWMTFTVEVWLCVAVTYALMTKSFQLFNKLNLSSGGRKISDPFMTSLQIVLGMGVCSLPKHVAGRILFVSCSVACFVIVILFQASMVTKLSTETSHKDIDTLEELDKSGMEIRTSLRYVRDALASNLHTESLANKIDLEKDRQGYIASRFVFIARIMNLSVSKYPNFIGRFQQQGVALHIVGECPLKYYLTYAIAINFPFLDELNDLITRFQESGITYKWKTEMQKLELVYYEPLNSNSSKGLKAYSLNDLWFAFVFLFVGYILSMIALMLEFIFKNIKT